MANATLHAAFAGLSLVLAVGSIQMLRLRMYPFAMVSCFLSMLNFGNLCCCAGLVFGVWGLVVLFRPEVREAFQ